MGKIASTLMLFILVLSSLPAIGGLASAADKIPVIVSFNGRPDAALIHAFGGEIKYEYTLIPAIACSLPEQAIQALSRNPNVSSIEYDGEVTILDVELDNSWGVTRIGAGSVQAQGNSGQGVNVAILDTGIDYNHPELKDNYKGGIDFINNDDDPRDDHGHGTHVAGIVAAEDNGVGVVGVAPLSSIYAVKVLNYRGSGAISVIVAGIQWAVNNHMDIISMSLGTSTNYSSLKAACDNAVNEGVLVVAAAGNEGDGDPATTEYSYPGAYASVIGVGATNSADIAASWSNTGAWLDIAAPGVSVYSTLPTYRVTLSKYGYSYGYLSGTSMATPHVAGVAALILAAEPSLTVYGVKARLNSTANDLGVSGHDNVYGNGLVDADEAAGSFEDTTPPTITNMTPSDGTNVDAGTVTVSAVVKDNVAVDENSILMTVDGGAVDYTYNSGTGLVSYQATFEAVGSHSVALSAADSSGNKVDTNWGFDVVASTPPPATQSMHVDSVTVVTSVRKAGSNSFVSAIATVLVVDGTGNPVAGATVSGSWTGATTDSDTGITDSHGEVSLTSNSVKNPKTSITFTFNVADVSLSGWEWDGVVSGDSESYSP